YAPPPRARRSTLSPYTTLFRSVALQFRSQFPLNRKLYEQACKDGSIDIGRLLVVRDYSLATGKKIIVNFPTKRDWRKPSEYAYIDRKSTRLNSSHVKISYAVFC